MLEAYKKQFLSPKVQFIVISEKGDILDSDDVLFPFKKEKNIIHCHPFFESVIPLLNHTENSLSFSCVHIGEKICDINCKTFRDQDPLIIIHDLTDHYQSLQTVTQKRNETVIESEILTLHNTYLQEKEAFKRTFIANFSHEIRNPLTGVFSFTEMLEKTSLSDEQYDLVEVVKALCQDLNIMINDILDLSKIEVGKFAVKNEIFNFTELLETTDFIYGTKARQKKLQFRMHVDKKLPKYIEGDKTRIKQVLTNVIENAIKFTEEGHIDLYVKLNHKRANKVNIQFEITDTGIGIPKKHINDIFTSFTQVHKDNKYSGTGLGLTIVKNLVTLMQGEIAVESEPGKGTSIKFNLRLKFPINYKEPQKKDRDDNKVLFNPKKKHNILLVEDNKISQIIVLKILSSQGAFYLDIAENGQQAMERVEETQYDLILLDIRLPDVTGYELAPVIRSLPEKKYAKIPIVALSGSLMGDNKTKYKKSAMNDVLQKPFQEQQLLKTLHKFLK
ncbi:ATP-binding protein [Sinomicrobium weinanense]|uniref:histidine kinase n=1 Tax=Sinomicrobium weinanense TaxID=2842200 RepID=A0A926JU88_9FLAO|nr:ATP-binding protein [Sinomicrobium weinanense]MBC9797479.1 response regulator [Sinomicrobium weinanense]MBU3124471.1 response regulator [Sinomicrobium weinanense]